MATVRFTEEEAELTMLAIEHFLKTKLHEYDDEDRPEVQQNLKRAERKLRYA